MGDNLTTEKMSWPTEHDPKNPDASPDFDSWGWDDYWKIDDWMDWHAAMKSKYGITHANQNFLAAWNEQGLGANPLDARTFNATFRQYARDNGFFDGLWAGAGVFSPILRTYGAAAEAAPSIAENAGAAIQTTASLARYILPIVALGVGAIYLAPYLAPALKRAAKAIR